MVKGERILDERQTKQDIRIEKLTNSTSTCSSSRQSPFLTYGCSSLVASYTISLFKEITAKPATSAGDNKNKTVHGEFEKTKG